MTMRSSEPTSPSVEAAEVFMEFCAMSLPRTPSRLETARESTEASVRMPKPPTKTPMIMTSWPKNDQWVAVETTVSPVTHTAETAVNRASCSGVCWPLAVAAGKREQRGEDRDDQRKGESARRAGERTVNSAEARRHWSRRVRHRAGVRVPACCRPADSKEGMFPMVWRGSRSSEKTRCGRSFPQHPTINHGVASAPVAPPPPRPRRRRPASPEGVCLGRMRRQHEVSRHAAGMPIA